MFTFGLTLGLLPALFFLWRWLVARSKLRELRETTDDIRAWDAGYLTEPEPTGRHARVDKSEEVLMVDEPVTEPVTLPGKRTPMWYDLITDWANAHDPTVAVPAPPRLQPAAFADTMRLPTIQPRAPRIGFDVVREPQIDTLPLKPKAAIPVTTWPVWGQEPAQPLQLEPATLWQVIGDRLYVGLVEFETSGQWINEWLLARLEWRVGRVGSWLVALWEYSSPKAPTVRPKRYYPMTASTTRWEPRGGAR